MEKKENRGQRKGARLEIREVRGFFFCALLPSVYSTLGIEDPLCQNRCLTSRIRKLPCYGRSLSCVISDPVRSPPPAAAVATPLATATASETRGMAPTSA